MDRRIAGIEKQMKETRAVVQVSVQVPPLGLCHDVNKKSSQGKQPQGVEASSDREGSQSTHPQTSQAGILTKRFRPIRDPSPDRPLSMTPWFLSVILG